MAHGELSASDAHFHRAHSPGEKAGDYKPGNQHFSGGSTGWCESPEETSHPAKGVQEDFLEEVASKLRPSGGTGSGRSEELEEGREVELLTGERGGDWQGAEGRGQLRMDIKRPLGRTT